MTPAEEITAAAALMRERAEKAAAAPGPWQYRDEWVRAGNCHVADMYAPDYDAVGQHIAGMHPLFALAVAQWLGIEAAVLERGLPDESGTVHPALRIARAYLRTEETR